MTSCKLCLVIHPFWGSPMIAFPSYPPFSCLFLNSGRSVQTLLARSSTLDVPKVHNQRLEVRARNWLHSIPPWDLHALPCRGIARPHEDIQEKQQRVSSVELVFDTTAGGWLPRGYTRGLKSSQEQKASLKYFWWHAMAFQMSYHRHLPCTRTGCWALELCQWLAFPVLMWWQQKEYFYATLLLTALQPLGNWNSVTRKWISCFQPL